MKQRYKEVDYLLTKMIETMEERGLKVEMQAKQLYHDREEITVFIERIID